MTGVALHGVVSSEKESARMRGVHREVRREEVEVLVGDQHPAESVCVSVCESECVCERERVCVRERE